MELYVRPLHTVPREDLSGFVLLGAPIMPPPYLKLPTGSLGAPESPPACEIPVMAETGLPVSSCQLWYSPSTLEGL